MNTNTVTNTYNPSSLFTDENGTPIPFDVFPKYSRNYNGLICGESGTGKSFLVSKMVSDAYASEIKIVIIDKGRTYRKLCTFLGGKYINLTKESEICPATFKLEIKNNNLIVFDFDDLSDPDLFGIASNQLLNCIKNDLSTSRSYQKKLIVIDEAFQFLRYDTSKVVEEVSKMAEICGAAFMCVTQSTDDINCVKTNFANKIYFRQSNPKHQNMDHLKSLKSIKGSYSEVYLENPSYHGIVRMPVDPVRDRMYCSEPADVKALLEDMVKVSILTTPSIS
jgi:type IV secretory pathway VirB4 component